MIEPAGVGQTLPRAFLRVGGSTLARHQLGTVLALECRRIVCIAREISADLIALQHVAEDVGVAFQVIANARALPGLVTAADEVVVLSEGLLAVPQEMIALLGGDSAVLVQPVEGGIAAGFERIDINHAAAGAARIPGRLVERLADLPADCDIPSALTRVALQAGIPMREVPAQARAGVRWRLVRDEIEAHAIEGDWIKLHVGDGHTPTPGNLLARFAVLGVGPSLLHAGTSGRLVGWGAVATMLLALGAGWLAYIGFALTLCAAAWIIRRAAVLLERVEHDSLSVRRMPLLRFDYIGWLLDIEIIMLVVWSEALAPWDSVWPRMFPPLILLCLLRLLPRVFPRGWTRWLDDRALVAILLAVAAWVGVLQTAVQMAAALLAVVSLALPSPRAQITRP